jgi:uncharacterized protein (TIGR03437 family)
MRKGWAWLGAAAALCLGYSNGLPIGSTGAAADGGRDCSSCHQMTVPDPRGKVTLEAGPYQAGKPQRIRVTVTHPEAARWGFQLTARALNDPGRPAGQFTPTGEVRVLCAPDGRDAPCGGEREFAAHRAQSTGAGAASGKTWEVEWTPPGEEVGRIRLYAAGLAANGDGRSGGDRTYTATMDLGWAGPCALRGTPVVSAVVNGASFESGAGIAPNAMIAIFGQGFAEAGRQRAAGAGDFEDGRFPRTLGCVAVEVGGRRAPLAFVGAGQINAQAPAELQGAAAMQVILNPDGAGEMRSALSAPVRVSPYSPAFFTLDGKSIAAQHASYELMADPALVPGGRPARPGDVVILYGTGFGPTEPPYPAGELAGGAARLRTPIEVSVGGTSLRAEDVVYAGLSPGSISGLYQVNLRLPAALPDGNVPVEVRIGGARTQAGAVIPVRR